MERYNLTSKCDGLNISMIVTKPQNETKAVLQLIHGMCGIKERYEPIMEYLAAHGIACIASDLRGHGESVRSSRDLGYMYKGGYKALVSDLRQVSDWGHLQFPELPYFILGHSMGSLAARIYIKENDSGLNGAIICGSPSWVPMAVFGKWISALFCAMGFGHARAELAHNMTSTKYNRRFASEGQLAWICSDPEVRRKFRENPLCNFRFTFNGIYNLLAMLVETYNSDSWRVTNASMPVIFLAGSDDPCIISEQDFHRAAYKILKAGYHNVSSAIYPNMRHEILNEIGKETVWNDIISFIEAENFGND